MSTVTPLHRPRRGHSSHALGSSDPRLRVLDLIESHPERATEYERALQSVDLLAQWRDAVETLPEVSPQLARAFTATERFWDAVDREFGLLTAAQLGRRLGSRAKDPGSMVAKRQQSGRLLWVRRGGRLLFPGFQVDGERGDVFPVVPELLHLAADRGVQSPELIQWLLGALDSLGGARPVDLLGEPERLLGAAERSWSAEW